MEWCYHGKGEEGELDGSSPVKGRWEEEAPDPEKRFRDCPLKRNVEKWPKRGQIHDLIPSPQKTDQQKREFSVL